MISGDQKNYHQSDNNWLTIHLSCLQESVNPSSQSSKIGSFLFHSLVDSVCFCILDSKLMTLESDCKNDNIPRSHQSREYMITSKKRRTTTDVISKRKWIFASPISVGVPRRLKIEHHFRNHGDDTRKASFVSDTHFSTFVT